MMTGFLSNIWKHKFFLAMWLGLIVGMYYLSQRDYLLFHSLIEIYSVVVACAIFIFAWNTRGFAAQSYINRLGFGYLFVGILDLLHTLAYKGLPVFPDGGVNLATQLWVAARYFETVTLCLFVFAVRRRFRITWLAGVYVLAFAVLIVTIFVWKIFPIAYLESSGLTPFKIISEYVISGILLAALVMIVLRRQLLDSVVYRYMVASIVLTIASEVCFTLYTDPFGTFNMLGHLLKLLSFYCVYKVVITTGLIKPVSYLFRDLQTHQENLEGLVEERTNELVRTQQMLRNLTRETYRSTEQERRRIARQIHDEIGQIATAEKIDLLWLKSHLTDADEALSDKINGLIEMVEETYRTVRNIIQNLRPTVLDDIGLTAALEWQAGELKKQTGIEFEFNDHDGAEVRDQEAALAVFRIYQEILSNVVRHSAATRIKIDLSLRDGLLKLMVDDNGRGISHSDIDRPDAYGIIGMRERAGDIGARLEISGLEHEGTTILLEVPLEGNQND